MTRIPVASILRRSWLPTATFVAALGLHFGWQQFLSAQRQWISIETMNSSPGLRRYLESGSYWLGFSYALSLAFAVVALRRYREQRLCRTRTLTIGSVTLSGVFALAGCYLLGCCGSPMLAVYLSLLGAAYLPLAKPLIFSFTIACILVAWWWMNRARC